VNVKGEDGRWKSIGEILNQSPDWWAGEHGLYAPPRDYIRFEQALLRGGELNGVRILQQATVDAAFTNQIGELDFPAEHPTADLAARPPDSHGRKAADTARGGDEGLRRCSRRDPRSPGLHL
jgi:CubicO group peptidase (beta-lactamase class C family)